MGADLYARNVWRDDLFKNKVVYCTGGAGSICSAQVRALVALGANAVIIGRRQAPLEAASKQIEAVRPGAQCLGVSADVRNIESMKASVAKALEKFGHIDFVIAGM